MIKIASLFAEGCQKGQKAISADYLMQYRLVYARIINGANNVSTSCKNLVNISPVTLEFVRVQSGIFVATRPQFHDRLSHGTLSFRNGLEYRNYDFIPLIVVYFSTSYINVVRFGSVTPEFKT